MTKDAGLLNDTELAAVAGGTPTLTLIRTSSIVLPNIPKYLLTEQQIDKLLSPPLNLPVSNG